MIKRILLIIAVFCFVDTTHAAYSISRLGKNEGLMNSTVNCLVEDDRGFVWVGTNDGLYRFDGNRFYRYRLSIDAENNKNKENTVRQVYALTLSPDSKLWFSTVHGIHQLDLKTEQMSTYSGNFKERLSSVTQLYVDRHNMLWALSYMGITLIDPATQHATTIDGTTGVVATQVTETEDGIIWFTALDGNLYRYDRLNKRIHPFKILSENEKNDKTFLVSAISYNGKIAIATSNRGVRVFNTEDKTITSLPIFDENKKNLFIHTIACDKNKRLCLGTENGLYIYELENGNVNHFSKSLNFPNSLSDNAVHSIIIKNKAVWAGTFFGGVNVINMEPSVISNYLPTDSNGILCGNIIRSMSADNYSRIWIGSEDCGLLLFDMKNKTLIKQNLKWNNENLPDNIQGMDIAGDMLVVGTFDKGVYVIDVAKNIVTDHLNKLSVETDIANGIVAFVLFVDNETCLLGTSYGLYSYNVRTKRIDLVESMRNSFIHTMRKDAKGRIWIGTLNNGLFCIEKNSRKMTVKKTGFPYMHISCIFESSNKQLYIGTIGNGLTSFNPATGKTDIINLTDNAEDLTISSIEETENGHLWISTTSGLFDYNLQNNEVITCYMQSKSLPNDHFNYASSCSDHNGNLYFGTYGGLVVFNHCYIESETEPLKVLVTAVEGKTFYKGAFQDNYFQTSYDKSTFALYFSSPSQSLSRQIWYRYKIEGLDDEWTIVSSPSPVEFRNLPAGNYKVLLQASYFNGVWENPTTEFTIEVTPPIWKSTFAYILYIAILIGILYLLFRTYRQRWNKRHEQQMKALNEEKEKQNLQEKIKFFTTITHEIRTPLALVMGSVERLANEKTEEKNPNIQCLQNNSNRLLNLVNQLLDFRKIESEQLYMNFTDIDIIPVITQLCDDLEELAQKRNIQFSFKSQMEQCTIVGDKDSVNKIFNNILTNALKFANTYVNVSIEKQVKDNQNYMVVRTNNDGNIIPESMQKEIFKPFVQHYDNQQNTTIKGSGLGLSLVKSLAELHGGVFYYDKSFKDCNSFVLEIPMLITTEKEGEDLIHAQDDSQEERNHYINVSQTESNRSETPTILVVDDEDELRSFVAEELSAHYNVLEARNGVEALKCLKSSSVSLVVTDLMMPLMNGIQLCKEMRADIRFSHIPIVVLTAKTSLNDHIEALHANADAYIEKPFNTEHLHAQISNLIKNRELLQNLYLHSPYSLSIGSITTNKTDEDFLRKMDEFIALYNSSNTHYSKNVLTVEALADHMAMSTPTLYRKVKSVTSLSPKEYIQLHRLKEAARLLKEQNKTIKQVTEELGFSNVSHFTQCFIKQFGITPSKFKKDE